MTESLNYENFIVIGCSLGGQDALSTLLKPLPKDYPFPIIVVQHREKYGKSLLEEVLQHKIKLKIKQADEKEKIQGSTVYIAPPDYHLLVEFNLMFSLSSDDPVNFSRPSIDVLFESASEACKDKLIGIILTGANADGSNGISRIRKNGGRTIAQDPASAEGKTMPESAIKTGNVQKILDLNQISNYLLSIYEKK